MAVGGAIAAVIAAGYFLNSTANRIVTIQAERTSMAWAAYIGSELQRIEEIVSGANFTPAEQDFLAGARQFGRIFRFKLFDRNGVVRLISDDLNTDLANNPDYAEDNSKAQSVVTTGRPYTELVDGTSKANRPDLYAETYVPVIRNGDLVAVVEVYVDETAQAATIKADFLQFGLKITGAMLLGLCLPGFAIVFMLRQMHGQNEKLKTAETAKSNFLAHMSHELRTPLNSIIGFSEMLGTEQFGKIENEKYMQYVANIHASGSHLLRLINDILDISKIAAGETIVDDKKIAVRDVIHDTIELLSRQVSEKNVAVSVEGPHNGTLIRADPRLCKRIFLNLLDNAIKFSDGGGVVTIRYGTNDLGGTIVSIENTGVSIAPEDLEQVLEPFGQARAGIDTAHEGTGLGLSLCMSLMEIHDGTLEIESESGGRTIVTVSFPPGRTVHSSGISA